MAQHSDRRGEGEWSAQWHDGRRQVSVWMGRGQEWVSSQRAQAEEAKRAQARERNALLRVLLWVAMIPIGILAAALGLGAFVLALAIGLVVLAFVAWAGMGIAGAAIAANRGRSGQLGWVLGMTLGPIGVWIVNRFF